MSPPTWGPGSGQNHRDQQDGGSGAGEEMGSWRSAGTELRFGRRKVLEMDGG